MLRSFAIILALISLQIAGLAEDSDISLFTSSSAPYFESGEFMLSAERFDTIVLKIRSSQSGTARILWAPSYDPRFDQGKSIWFYVKPGTHTYYFNALAQNPAWVGWIKKMILYPDFDKSSIEIKSLRLSEGSLMTDLSSGWLEFWGPKGRIPIGSTINVIGSNNFNGIAINSMVYWLIFMATAVFLTINFIKIKPFDLFTLWEKTGLQVFFTAIILWGLLEVSSTYTYMNNLRSDWPTYFGKTPQQKARAFAGEIYDFISFCDQKLPKDGVDVSLVWSDSEGPQDLRARYYLYPNRLGESAAPYRNVPYILVHHQNYQDPAYQLFAKFKEGEYILKKK